MDMELIRKLAKPADTRIVMLIMDGLGGLPGEDGLTELETAKTPHLDDLAARGICGLHEPIGTGITPGSGPSHQALFGYDPVKFYVGRGALAAIGIGFDLRPRDVVARGNFCTISADGRIADRRAGRISTERNRQLCRLLSRIELSDAELFVEAVKGYRFLFVLRGEGLSSEVADSDPQEVGRKPLEPEPLSTDAEKTVALVRQFLNRSREILAEYHPANMVLLRGFASGPDLPLIQDIYKIRGIAIADYPMYRGIARLVGMKAVDAGVSVEDKVRSIRDNWDAFDLFFLHVKTVDIAGEDGDFRRKVASIEDVDANIPDLLNLKPDVIIVTGDHSTPSRLFDHSWHPVPVLLWSAHCLPDRVRRFGERACMQGSLGPRFPTTDVMTLALAHALRLAKYGA